MSKADKYQKLAAECLLLASSADDQTNRLSLLHMAQTWLQFAEKELSRPGQRLKPKWPRLVGARGSFRTVGATGATGASCLVASPPDCGNAATVHLFPQLIGFGGGPAI